MNLEEAGRRIERLEEDYASLKKGLVDLIDLIEKERKAIIAIFDKYGYERKQD